MRQISNEFIVLSVKDANDLLRALDAGVAALEPGGEAWKSVEQLKNMVTGLGQRHAFSARELHTPSHAEPRLRYMVALNEEMAALRVSDQEAHLLEQTKHLMLPHWSSAGRVAAIKRVRQISGMGLPKAVAWVDSHYKKP